MKHVVMKNNMGVQPPNPPEAIWAALRECTHMYFKENMVSQAEIEIKNIVIMKW